MSIDMQVVYFGFPGSSDMKAEACTQLLRLDPFRKLITGCHLAIEAVSEPWGEGAPLVTSDNATRNAERLLFNVRLDLVLSSHTLLPLAQQQSGDGKRAIRAAFDAAVQLLQAGTLKTTAPIRKDSTMPDSSLPPFSHDKRDDNPTITPQKAISDTNAKGIWMTIGAVLLVVTCIVLLAYAIQDAGAATPSSKLNANSHMPKRKKDPIPSAPNFVSPKAVHHKADLYV
jgi:hypothetical protein